MKILIVSQYWAPENGVPQRRWSWLSQLLVEQGHQLTVIAPPPHYDRKISSTEWVRKFLAGGFNEEEFGESGELDRKSTRLNSSHYRRRISYAVFCLKKKTVPNNFYVIITQII